MDYLQKSKPKPFLTTAIKLKHICIFVLLLFQINASCKSIIYCENHVLKDMVEVISGGLFDVKVLPIPEEEDISLIKIIFVENTDNLPTLPPHLEPLVKPSCPVSFPPSYWINPSASTSQNYFKVIKTGLSQIDSLNADIYQFNEQLYSEQLINLERKILDSLDVIPPNKRIIFSDDIRFEYLAKGIDWTFISIHPDSGVSLEQAKEILLKQEIPAVFIQAEKIDKEWDELFKELDIHIIRALHTNIEAQADAPKTYFNLLEHNTAVFIEAMKRKPSPKESSPFPRWILIFALLPIFYLWGKVLSALKPFQS